MVNLHNVSCWKQKWGPMRALIVQSNCALGEIWRAHLERLGVLVDMAVDGFDAIAQIESTRFDAIVLDLMLEEGNALSVADMASFRQPDANVIFVTNTTFFSDGSIFAHSGNARALIQSGTSPKDLAQIVYHYGKDSNRADEALPSPAVG